MKDNPHNNIRLAEANPLYRKQPSDCKIIPKQQQSCVPLFKADGKVQEKPAAARVEVEDPDCQRDREDGRSR